MFIGAAIAPKYIVAKTIDGNSIQFSVTTPTTSPFLIPQEYIALAKLMV